jgi:hypothetical protein
VETDEKYVKSIKGVMLSVSTNDLQAFLKLVAAELEGQTLSVGQLRGLLVDAGVIYGAKQNVLEQLVASPVYGERILVAEGEPSLAGIDASIEYLFNTSATREPTVDAHGHIDYKDLNFIQSAKAGQVLARKTPALAGAPGKSVLGKEIAPKLGRDRALGRGANTELSADGLTLTAAMEGTIAFKSNVISIQSMQNIPGSIDASTGNVDCLGSLKINKDIAGEYRVTVGGDLEVGGNVEDAIIEVGGNVIIRGGFFGGGKGTIKAGGDVTIKYAEKQKIRAEGTVYIGGEVLSCDIYAGDAVIVQGKTGRIVGGNVAAKHLVRVSTLGSDAAVPTHVHVAYDMKTVERFRAVTKELERLANDEKRVKEAMVVMFRLELSGKLPADKKEILQRFKQFTKELPAQRDVLQMEQSDLKQQMQELSGARVVVEETIYAGTVIHFGPVYKEINEDISGAFVFEKTGDSIIRAQLSPERERAMAEQFKKSRQTQAGRVEAPVPV